MTTGKDALSMSVIRRPALGLLPLLLLAASGCAFSPPLFSPSSTAAAAPQSSATGVVRASHDESSPPSEVLSSEGQPDEPTGWAALAPENVSKTFKKAIGKGPSQPYAKQRFEEAEKLFDEKQYAAAAKKYAEAADRWPDSALEEDALFMRAESLFFDDRYSDANDLYGELLKKYGNSRHLDKAVQRQFLIAQYWIEHDEKSPNLPVTPNLTDKTRPWFDPHGNAIAAYDSIRMNDPRGNLADDATMAAANAYFVKRRYEEADYHYGLIRSEYPKSEHLVQAYLLGLQCKLKLYQGPDYDGKVLNEAEELIDQMLLQFPDQLRDERDRLLRSKAEVRAQLALREWNRAQFYEKNKYFGAAKFHYDIVMKEYPGTPFAKQSEERLAALGGLPDNPPDRFEFLNYVFGQPSGKAARR